MQECAHNWVKINECPKIEKEWVIKPNGEKVEVYHNVYQCSKCNLKREMSENEISVSSFEEGTLDRMINSLVNSDPFWFLTIKKFFDSLTISLDEKIVFLTKMANQKGIFNEFTKELVKGYTSDALYEKYSNLSQINLKNSTNTDISICPNCNEHLSKLMPDGTIFSCNKCGKYYKNDNGKVGNETTSPYTDNTVLY